MGKEGHRRDDPEATGKSAGVIFYLVNTHMHSSVRTTLILLSTSTTVKSAPCKHAITFTSVDGTFMAGLSQNSKEEKKQKEHRSIFG